MEPLKEMFNKNYYRQLSDAIKQVFPAFDQPAFLKDIYATYPSLELNERLRLTSRQLHHYLPADYLVALNILKKTAPQLSTGYTALVFPDYVSQFGLDHFELSLEALKYFTPFGSSEFAVRVFLKKDFAHTLEVMQAWAEDVDPHVRRLASEGSRPRLPWSFKLDQVIKNPATTVPILRKLQTDESLYVRKSVANHLNDFSKDHPEFLIDLVTSWDLTHPATAWIVRHACRTLIKKGHPRALKIFEVEQKIHAEVNHLNLTPSKLKIGDHLNFSFELVSTAEKPQKCIIDYIIHYRKKAGDLSPKVFKLKEMILQPHATIQISKKQYFADLTTRKHYPGEHLLEIQINGLIKARKTFHLKQE